MPPHRANPVDFVFANFKQLEEQLLDCMRYIPFVQQNQSVVSPKFVPIILESCSLIESIFRRGITSSRRHTLKSYCELMEPDLELAGTTTLLLTSPLQFLRPFHNWTAGAPAWWIAYNEVKHDRINKFDAATYDFTVSALAGLHQVIARTRTLAGNLAKVGWINEAHPNTPDLMLFENVGCRPPEIPAESVLFVSPVRGNFVDWNDDIPSVSSEWEFSWRVKFHIWGYEG